jgi:flagellar hook-associated protein FlgK
VGERTLTSGQAGTFKLGENYPVRVIDNPDTSRPSGTTPPDHDTAKFTVWPEAVDGQTITKTADDKAFIVTKNEVVQYIIDNSESLFAQDKAWDKNLLKKKGALVPVEFITPAGDPLNDPVDGGDGSGSVPDGANEFTYSTAPTGVLTLKLKAKVPGFGSMGPAIQGRFKFEVDTIGGSTLGWNYANFGGAVTANGDFLTATVTFTGLPQNNSDFGKKKARLMFDGAKAVEKEFEVFYDAKAKNHPGGNTTHTNWFHYYKQNLGSGTYGYNDNGHNNSGRSGSTSRGGDSSIVIGPEAFDGDEYITSIIQNGRLLATGWSSTTKYYANFCGVVAHERQHANNEVASGGPLDPDFDFLASSFENTTSKTDPANGYSASGSLTGNGWDDGEVYAGGPVEENALKQADTSKDWAKPGTNKKP